MQKLLPDDADETVTVFKIIRHINKKALSTWLKWEYSRLMSRTQ